MMFIARNSQPVHYIISADTGSVRPRRIFVIVSQS